MGGRGSSSRKLQNIATIPYENRKIIEDNVINKTYGEYQYHATLPTSIFSIYEQGLKTNRGHVGKGVYLAPSESDAIEWTTNTSTGGTFVLRVKSSSLYKKYKWDDIDGTESIAHKNIKSKDIEVKYKDKWVSLQEYVDNKYTSYRLWRNKNN